MSFRIEWIRPALERLTQVWLDAGSEDRGRITSAVADLERRLQRNALECGESRDGNRRVVFAPPLTVYYEVSDRLKLVSILMVVYHRRRSA